MTLFPMLTLGFQQLTMGHTSCHLTQPVAARSSNRLEGMAGMIKSFLVAACIALFCSSNAWAQKNEMSLIIGGGQLSGEDRSVPASAFSIGYTRSIIGGLAAEGSVDVFFVRNGSLARDDFAAAQAAVVYHFRPVTKSRSLVPYVVAGIGKVTTDFTEIPADRVVRLGGGLKYYFSEQHKFGFRVELRDEITTGNSLGYYPVSGSRLHLVSVRAGITCRF